MSWKSILILNRNIKRNRYSQLQSKRQFVPFLIAGGIAIVIGSTLGRYALRAYKRLNEDEGSDDSSKPKSKSQSNVSDSNLNMTKRYQSQQSIGIDLGSTYTKLSYRDIHDNNTIYQLIENRDGNRLTPTAIHFPSLNDDIVIGKFARNIRFQKPNQTINYISLLIGMKSNDIQYEMLSNSFSSVLSSSSNDTKIKMSVVSTNDEYTPEIIAKLIIKDIFQSVKEKFHYENKNLSLVPVVTSMPNFFNSSQQSELIKVLRSADINCVAAVSDAICAYLGAVELCQPPVSFEPNQDVLVIDIGGKLTQLSILRIKLSNSNLFKSTSSTSSSTQSIQNALPTIINQDTIFNVCGELFDEIVVNYLSVEFARRNDGMNLLLDTIAKQRIYDAVEMAKYDLSNSFTSNVNIPYIGMNRYGETKHFNMNLSRALYENILSEQIEILGNSIRSICRDVSLSHVILVGGGARMVFIGNLVETLINNGDIKHLRTGRKPMLVQFNEPEEVVSVGAAAYSKLF